MDPIAYSIGVFIKNILISIGADSISYDIHPIKTGYFFLVFLALGIAEGFFKWISKLDTSVFKARKVKLLIFIAAAALTFYFLPKSLMNSDKIFSNQSNQQQDVVEHAETDKLSKAAQSSTSITGDENAVKLSQYIDKQFRSFSKEQKCWIVSQKNIHYCMVIKQVNKVFDSTGDAYYHILMSGNALPQEDASRNVNGLISAFVLKIKDGKLTSINNDLRISGLGSFGLVPEDFAFKKIGSNLYAWVFLEHVVIQGYETTFLHFISPYKKEFKSILKIVVGYDERGNCDSSIQDCEQLPHIESNITINDKNAAISFYPIEIQLVGIDDQKQATNFSYSLTFDEKNWQYSTPIDYILGNK